MKRRSFTISIALILTALSSSNLLGQQINTIGGTGTAGYGGDGGAATAAMLHDPDGMSIDNSGNLYISDPANNRIRKITPAGIITTVAGNGTAGYLADGVQATSTEINNPTDVAVDAAGNIYIADEHNNRIRMVNPSGVISTIAGTGTAGFSGDGAQATAAKLDNPAGVYADASGNILVADYGNSRVRKITPSGVINTIAGTGTAGYSGDGVAATSSELNAAIGVTEDAAGNIIIADNFNNRVRKVNTSGIISTVAGNGVATFSGDGSAATNASLYWPTRVFVDGSGNILIADWTNGAIRQVNTSGIINTVAGNGTLGYSGDGGPATASELSHPAGVVADAFGAIYIDDEFNNRVRKVNSSEAVNEIFSNKSMKIYPNPATQNVNIALSNNEGNVNIEVMDITGKEVMSTTSYGRQSLITLDVSNLVSGIYFLNIKGVNTNLTRKFVKE